MPTSQPIDVRDMAIVHRTQRVVFTEAAHLVRAALAAALDRLNSVLQRHLDDEEQKIVPLAAVTLTQQEWDSISKHGVSKIPPNKRSIVFGMILDPLDKADRAHMKRVLPIPVRLLYPFLIERP
jgi:hypothetical protein